jgi:hypothetical protein
MALLRTRTLELALLLALMLPLQGFAASWGCGSFEAATAATQQHCTQGSGAAQQHHNCGASCCSAAIVLTPLCWVAPHSTRPQAAMPIAGSQPSVILDRLDRPPRFVLA